jgi:hypothetical protein
MDMKRHMSMFMLSNKIDVKINSNGRKREHIGSFEN